MTSRSRAGPVHRRGIVPQREKKPDLGHDHPLPEAHTALEWRDGHQAGVFPDERSHRVAQQRRRVPGVGVGEQEELAGSGPVSLVAGPRLSVPASRQLLSRYQAEPGIGQRSNDRGGVIGGPVVNDQQLDRLIRRRQDRAHHRCYGGRFVPRRDDHGDEPAGRNRRVGQIRFAAGEAGKGEERQEPGKGRQ